MPPSRALGSSVSAYCSSGSAPGPVGDVGDHRGDEAGLDREPDAARPGPTIARSSSLGRHRRDRLGARGEQVAEAADRQRLVVEVRAERRDDADPAARVGAAARSRRGTARARRSSSTSVNTSSSWSSTISSSALGVGQHALDGPDAARARPARARSSSDGGRVDGDAEQRRLELVERVRAGHHLDHEPALGARRRRRAAERRHQPGPHHATTCPTPTARRRRRNRDAGAVLGQPLDEPLRRASRARRSRAASASRNARRPLYGFADLGRDGRGATRSLRAPLGTPSRAPRRPRSARPGPSPSPGAITASTAGRQLGARSARPRGAAARGADRAGARASASGNGCSPVSIS